MTTKQFAYWLQGFFEINDPQTINKEQTQIIRDHLNLLFDKITPDRNINEESEEQEVINRPPFKKSKRTVLGPAGRRSNLMC